MSKHILIIQNISKVIIIIVISCLFYAPSAFAILQSTTYQISSYDFGSGGKFGNTSTTYSLYGNTGQLDGLKLTSTTYNALPGLTYTLTANVPGAPTVSNNSNQYYNKLNVTLNTASNPSDTVYAIQVVGSGTQYVQADDTLGASPVWQTNTIWGASGFNVIGLTPGTTYTFSVSAKQGTYTQSAFGGIAAVATANPTFSYSLNSNALTFPSLSPGTVQVSTSTVTATVTTNGSGGATVYAYDAYAGLLSSSTSYTINAVSSDLSSASEGYGLQATAVGQSSGGPMEEVSPYNGTGNVVGLLDSNKRNLFDSTNAPVTSGTGTFALQAKAGNTAKPASDYGDTLTVIASASF